MIRSGEEVSEQWQTGSAQLVLRKCQASEDTIETISYTRWNP